MQQITWLVGPSSLYGRTTIDFLTFRCISGPEPVSLSAAARCRSSSGLTPIMSFPPTVCPFFNSALCA